MTHPRRPPALIAGTPVPRAVPAKARTASMPRPIACGSTRPGGARISSQSTTRRTGRGRMQGSGGSRRVQDLKRAIGASPAVETSIRLRAISSPRTPLGRFFPSLATRREAAPVPRGKPRCRARTSPSRRWPAARAYPGDYPEGPPTTGGDRGLPQAAPFLRNTRPLRELCTRRGTLRLGPVR